MANTGKLFLIPNLLGESDPDQSITEGARRIVNALNHFIVESDKTARRHLRAIGFEQPFDDVQLYPIGKHSNPADFPTYLKIAESGEDMGILSEAGLPGIADPGSEIIALAHKRGIQVVPLPGPSSIILALIGSGMNGQQFSFHGYLPKERNDRNRKLQQMEKAIRTFGSQIFMETPFRNNQLLEDLLANCSASTRLCIACDITLESELIRTKSVSEWRKQVPDLNKRPTVFVMG